MSDIIMPDAPLSKCIDHAFVRATEHAALNAIYWAGRGEKDHADAAACQAIRATLNKMDMCGQVVSGEGIKDNAPGIFHGERLGTWRTGSPMFDIVLDPVDGTSNLARGMANSISAIGASHALPGAHSRMVAWPSFYSHKMAFGREIAQAMRNSGLASTWLDQPLGETLVFVARVLGKRISDVVVLVLDRPRNEVFIRETRNAGATLRMVSDGDVVAAISPALPDSDTDLYVGIGGTPEGILSAAALRALGGDIYMRMWFRTVEERSKLSTDLSAAELTCTRRADEIVPGENVIFCATGILDNSLLPGVRVTGKKAITHSVAIQTQDRITRFIRAVHEVDMKTVPLGSKRSTASVMEGGTAFAPA